MEERLKAIKYEVLTDYIESMASCIGRPEATEFEQGFDKACDVISSFAKTLDNIKLKGAEEYDHIIENGQESHREG